MVKNLKLIKPEKGEWFLWFTSILTGKSYCLFWECSRPIWKFPKLQITDKYIRIGWLLFACGVGTN